MTIDILPAVRLFLHLADMCLKEGRQRTNDSPFPSTTTSLLKIHCDDNYTLQEQMIATVKVNIFNLLIMNRTS